MHLESGKENKMANRTWHGPKWPEGVPYEISGYNKPLYSILDDAAHEFPYTSYTVFNAARMTFKEVKDTADRIAGFLISRGIKPQERVAIFLPNIPQYPAIFFGILRAGGVCVTCNPSYKPRELNFQLKDSGARGVFVMGDDKFYNIALEAIKGTEVQTVVICDLKSCLPPIKAFLGSIMGKIPKSSHHQSGHFLFNNVVKDATPIKAAPEIDPLNDYGVILYTGGTTGVPKGACLTHSNLLSDVIMVEEWLRLSHKPGEAPRKISKGGIHSFLGILPWYHAFGLTVCMLLSCRTASRLICIPDPRAGTPPFTEALKSIEKYKATIVVAVPVILSRLINHPLLEKFDLSSIMACGSGAGALALEVIKQFEEKTGAIIFEGYGLSETSPVITLNPTNLEQRKIGSVGLPLPNVDIKIVDIETGAKESGKGEDGEIAVNGPQVMAGYWGDSEKIENVFSKFNGDRYFLTGDIGHLNEEGFLFITDRKKDMIKVSGFNVYPSDVEEILYTHRHVELAAVIGIPDPETGEAVKAFIQLKPGAEVTEDEFCIFCKERLAGYKCPREIEFRETMPLSSAGKLLKKVLREEELKKRTGS
jgi:long-chain acyl-CoA synthetase